MEDKIDTDKRYRVKTSRQIAIFHIFLCSEIVEIIDIEGLINIIKETSKKTIIRDIKDLQNAGLINIKYSRKENGYIHNDPNNPCPFLAPTFSDNKAKNRSIEKLIRLATIMVELANNTELYYYNNSGNQETCVNWYKKKFPNISTRTMWRDFKELSKIGYNIEYDFYERCYIIEIPDGLEGLHFNLEYMYSKKT